MVGLNRTSPSATTARRRLSLTCPHNRPTSLTGTPSGRASRPPAQAPRERRVPLPPRVPPQVRQRAPLAASPERGAPLQVPPALPQVRQRERRGPLPAQRVPRTPQMLRQQELPPQLAAPVQRTLPLLLLLEQRPTQAI